MSNQKEMMYDKFIDLQREVHLKNQKKIRVGLKINLLLPLIFLALSFFSDRSKLVFLVLWIVTLFGIAFYLLYVEYMDFKLQKQWKEFGIIDKETEAQALIGDEVVQGIDDINQAQKEIVQDLKEAKKEVVKDLKDARKEVVQDIKDFRQDIKTDIKSVGDKLKK